MSTSRVVQVPAPGQGLQLAEREVPRPARGEVLVRIEACGVCHSDSLTVEGAMPSIEYPIVPGHEIAGRIEAVGEGVVPGRSDSGSVSAGSAGTAGTATRAAAAT